MDEEHSDREIGAAHMGPAGPAVAALAWLYGILVRRDLKGVWKDTDPDLRLCLAQSWLSGRSGPDAVTPELEEVAAELARRDPSHPEWAEFAEQTIDALAAKWSFVEDLSRWGAWGRPEPLTQDLEIVFFVDAQDPRLGSVWTPPLGYTRKVAAGTELASLPLVMRHTRDAWLVAGFSQAGTPTPGWPPHWPLPRRAS